MLSVTLVCIASLYCFAIALAVFFQFFHWPAASYDVLKKKNNLTKASGRQNCPYWCTLTQKLLVCGWFLLSLFLISQTYTQLLLLLSLCVVKHVMKYIELRFDIP